LCAHPAYAAAPFLFVGGGLALGSFLTALIGLLLVAPIIWRTAQKDRVLLEHLEGYRDYAERVRYRIFPGLW
jgi:protein-S-isoprenylcysteine O-methyltransferase Ste14